MAKAVLGHVDLEVTRGRALDDVLAELAPQTNAAAGIEPLLRRWLEIFEKRVSAGSRQPRTLREYRRWAGHGISEYAHFAFWYGRTVHDVDRASLEEWEFWLFDRGLSAKTVRNVMAGFRSFLSWVGDQRRGFVVPRFPWPELDEHQPTILSEKLQWNVLREIPEPKRGIFLCMAFCLVRPSEARALRVRDWEGDDLRVSRAAKDRKTRGTVRGLKSRNTKVLPVDITLELWLPEFVSAERRIQDPDGPLFVNPDGKLGGWWSETAMRRAWATACKKAGVSGVSLYEGTKHSRATHLKAMGADDRILARLMGHRDPRSVEKYARLQGSAIRNALFRLEKDRDRD
jgi:integrase